MKKIFSALVIIGLVVLAASCRTSKYGCPTVAGHSSSKFIKAG